MQIIDESGSRELESWEIEALEAAQKAHDEAVGIIRQYPQSKTDEMLKGILANMADIPEYDAVRMLSIYPAWKAGIDYSQGWRVRYNDKLWTVLQAHTSQDDWRPDESPSLYAQVLPGQAGSDEAESGGLAEWVQPDSTNPYMAGDRVMHDGRTWESLVDNNVWEPSDDVPTLWQEIE